MLIYSLAGIAVWILSLILCNDEDLDTPFLWLSPGWFFTVVVFWPIHILMVSIEFIKKKYYLVPKEVLGYHWKSANLFITRFIRDIKSILVS